MRQSKWYVGWLSKSKRDKNWYIHLTFQLAKAVTTASTIGIVLSVLIMLTQAAGIVGAVLHMKHLIGIYLALQTILCLILIAFAGFAGCGKS